MKKLKKYVEGGEDNPYFIGPVLPKKTVITPYTKIAPSSVWENSVKEFVRKEEVRKKEEAIREKKEAARKKTSTPVKKYIPFVPPIDTNIIQSDNARIAKSAPIRNNSQYTDEDLEYFKSKGIPKELYAYEKKRLDNWKEEKKKEAAEITQRRKDVAIQAQKDLDKGLFTQAVAEDISNGYRLLDNDNFVDNWLNPFQWVLHPAGNLAGNFAIDAGPIDPWNVAKDAGLLALNAIGFKGATQLLNPLARGLKNGLVRSTESGLLSNTYKLNPWAFKPKFNSYYHRSPNLENVINSETGMLQGFGLSEEGKAYSQIKDYFPGRKLNLRKSANNQLYFSKGVPLDYGRYNPKTLNEFGKHIMTGQGYEGPYLIEVDGIPMGRSVKGRKPSSDPPTNLEGYAVSHRPIHSSEAKFYKEDWLQGYKKLPKTYAKGGETQTEKVNPTKEDYSIKMQSKAKLNAIINKMAMDNFNWINKPLSEVQQYLNTIKSPEIKSIVKELNLLNPQNLMQILGVQNNPINKRIDYGY